jgi:hypothetical protein
MRRFLTVALLVLAVVVGLVQATASVDAATGVCQCPKGNVCCRNCDGSFAYCARSFAFCPECAAP